MPAASEALCGKAMGAPKQSFSEHFAERVAWGAGAFSFGGGEPASTCACVSFGFSLERRIAIFYS